MKQTMLREKRKSFIHRKTLDDRLLKRQNPISLLENQIKSDPPSEQKHDSLSSIGKDDDDDIQETA